MIQDQRKGIKPNEQHRTDLRTPSSDPSPGSFIGIHNGRARMLTPDVCASLEEDVGLIVLWNNEQSFSLSSSKNI